MNKKGCFGNLLVLGFVVVYAAAWAVAAWAVEAEQVKGGEEGWIKLFNGKNIKGWKTVGEAAWTVEKGVLIGRQGPGGKVGELLTEKEFDDFELTCTYKVDWPANTGVWFRYQTPKKAYQADILEYKNPEAYSGTLYCPGKMFLAKNLDKKLEKRDTWNVMQIRAQGDHLVIHLNKKKVADVHDKTSDRGRIGFQVHAGDQFKNMAVHIKEINIRLLEKGAK